MTGEDNEKSTTWSHEQTPSPRDTLERIIYNIQSNNSNNSLAFLTNMSLVANRDQTKTAFIFHDHGELVQLTKADSKVNQKEKSKTSIAQLSRIRFSSVVIALSSYSGSMENHPSTM